MSDGETCACGHVRDEHGTRNKKKYPNSMECLVDDCDCIAFDPALDEDDE